MKIIPLKKSPDIYTCNAFLVLGTWNTLDDNNTLIDVGTDGYIIKELDTLNTGVGKRRVEQVIFTHSHFDHMAGLKFIKEKYNPVVFAFTKFDGVDVVLRDGDKIKIGDADFEVIHTPGHSDDSIILYNHEEGVIFCGDNQMRINIADSTYDHRFVAVISRLARLNITKIYHGHDDPVIENAGKILMNSLNNILNVKVKKEEDLLLQENSRRIAVC